MIQFNSNSIQLFTNSRVHISKPKKHFNVKSSTYYFHMKAKILALVCISVPLKLEVKFGDDTLHYNLVGWFLHDENAGLSR